VDDARSLHRQQSLLCPPLRAAGPLDRGGDERPHERADRRGDHARPPAKIALDVLRADAGVGPRQCSHLAGGAIAPRGGRDDAVDDWPHADQRRNLACFTAGRNTVLGSPRFDRRLFSWPYRRRTEYGDWHDDVAAALAVRGQKRSPPNRRIPRAGLSRRNSCSARPPGHHGWKTTTSVIERLALETGERAACASSLVKPIRSAVECERRLETKAGRSGMSAVQSGRSARRRRQLSAATFSFDNTSIGVRRTIVGL